MRLAVGFFDGVHLGHRRILASADAALTFRNHPATVFAPARAPRLLMTASERLDALAHLVSHVRALDFTPALAEESAEAFADWLRHQFPDLETICCGPNWTFGRGGVGTADFLRARGFAVETVPFVVQNGEPVSSTRIRRAIAAGDMAAATAMLGHPWRVAGDVFSGKGLGRTLGTPTLNVRWTAERICPPRGVYAVETNFGRGVANFGVAPTLGTRAWPEPVLEVHLLAAADVSARRTLAVTFLKYLRPERTFASLTELQRQIARDADAARLISSSSASL